MNGVFKHLVGGADGFGAGFIGALRDDHIYQFLDDIDVGHFLEALGNGTEAFEAGLLKDGMLIGMVAFGSGFTWGSALLRW